jgi:predicted TIM-barrel fold metal-dependent hydrolase
MPIPEGLKVIETMMGIPTSEDNSGWYDSFKSLLMDEESRNQFKMPAQYMFKDIPKTGPVEDRVAWTVAQMDRFNIERALVGFSDTSPTSLAAHSRFPDRFFFNIAVDPNLGMEEVRRIRRMKREYGIAAISLQPAMTAPQVAIDDKKAYPIYATCVEEELPVFCTVGVPGPRVPGACQHVERVDEVCWFFPELKFVMRHGAEPYVDMAVKLLLKWPNLYYSTSAFAPKHYPKAIIDFMNKRGADKVLYAGYFPMGLSLERIFAELAELPIRDEVWPKFLRENALKLLAPSRPA